tara:strand:+ start:1034 stop:1546 length:513 start_codon:yes stop_codon:yes gene_type:complete
MGTITFLKKTIKIAGIFTSLLVLISFKTDNNDLERKDVQVVLVIDTDGINVQNLDTKVLFVNVGDSTSSRTGNPSNFITKVYKNKKIQWSAVPKDETSGLTIDVLFVFRKQDGGVEMVDDYDYDKSKKGVVVAKIKNKKVEGFENYNVIFRINEEPVRTFQVDPKLQMVP